MVFKLWYFYQLCVCWEFDIFPPGIIMKDSHLVGISLVRMIWATLHPQVTNLGPLVLIWKHGTRVLTAGVGAGTM